MSSRSPARSPWRALGSSRAGRAGLVAGVAGLAGLLLAATPAVAGQAAAGSRAGAAASVSHASCAAPTKDRFFRCMSVWRSTAVGAPAAGASVAPPSEGYGPADINSAYKLPKVGGSGQTVAIVDAFDNPKAEANLAAYRKAWGLPACTTANGCFRKVDQRGGTSYPVGDPGWGVEIALDVQAASAACPGCNILLVEADDNSYEALGKAVSRAVKLGANVVSNSYSGSEYNGIIDLANKYFVHPGVPIVASSGDFGFTDAGFPASLGSVWAIGGTSLTKTAGGGWSESVWGGAGSGCSAWFAKPSYQKDRHCSMRTISDVSAVADPATGFAVYDTYGLGPDNGWIVVGGTSVSAPLISGMIGLAGNSAAASSPAYAYSHRLGLKDVVGGSNGFCGGDYLCTGLKGYDGPSGLGSPRGVGSL